VFKTIQSKLIMAGVAFTFAFSAAATIVEFQTSQGNFQVNLFDETTPKTVNNFLTYVNDGHYTDSIVHRSVPGFIVQGGGFTFNGVWELTRSATNAPVVNEPVYSNVRGTIAMAKLSTSKDSATDQWFFNLANNSGNLDTQNGGFTVFGQVVGDGMTVVDSVAALQTCSDRPVVNYTSEQCTSGAVPGAENLVTVYQVIIIDSAANTAATLTPAKNTLINASNTSTSSGSGSGGAVWALLALIFTGVGLRKIKR
jgi:peptidyl-prolyl cis-trans isomerase A (cyclophilin A)